MEYQEALIICISPLDATALQMQTKLPILEGVNWPENGKPCDSCCTMHLYHSSSPRRLERQAGGSDIATELTFPTRPGHTEYDRAMRKSLPRTLTHAYSLASADSLRLVR
jgi:hypothetical protein